MGPFFHTCKQAPLTEYDMLRARTVLGNNRMLQSLGIHAIASLVSKRNAVKEVREVTSDESASAVTQGEDPDYIPKEKEVTDGEEVDDTLVKTVKVQISCLEGWEYFVCLYYCLFYILCSHDFLFGDLMWFFLVACTSTCSLGGRKLLLGRQARGGTTYKHLLTWLQEEFLPYLQMDQRG